MRTKPAESPSPVTGVSDPPRRWPVWVRALVVPCVLMFGNYVLYLPLALVLSPWLNAAPGWVQGVVFVILGCVVAATAIVFVVILMRYVDRRPVRDAGLFFSAGSIPAFLLGVLASVVVIVPAGFALESAGLLREVQPMQGSAGAIVLSAVVAGLIVQGFPEELVWRGYLMQTVDWRPWPIALYSSAVFAALHILSSGGQQGFGERLLYVVQAFAFAFLAAALYRATGQLWAAVGVHAGLHFTHAWTESVGIGSGPNAWLVETAGYLILGVAVMIWCDRTGRNVPRRRHSLTT